MRGPRPSACHLSTCHNFLLLSKKADEDTSLPFPLDQSCATLKQDQFAYLVAFAGASCVQGRRRWRMVEARRIKKRAEVRKIDPWRQRWRAAAVEDGAGAGAYSKENVGARTLGCWRRMASSARSSRQGSSVLLASRWACPTLEEQGAVRSQGCLSVMLAQNTLERTHVAKRGCESRKEP